MQQHAAVPTHALRAISAPMCAPQWPSVHHPRLAQWVPTRRALNADGTLWFDMPATHEAERLPICRAVSPTTAGSQTSLGSTSPRSTTSLPFPSHSQGVLVRTCLLSQSLFHFSSHTHYPSPRTSRLRNNSSATGSIVVTGPDNQYANSLLKNDQAEKKDHEF